MKNSFIPVSLSLSLLIPGLSFSFVPEASAKLAKPKVKRCLTRGISIRAMGTQQRFDSVTMDPISAPHSFDIKGFLGRRSGQAEGIDFTVSRIVVRGRNKVIIHGNTQVRALKNSNPGSLKVVVMKRGRRARITSGRFTYSGEISNSTQILASSNGRITGGKRLSRSCAH